MIIIATLGFDERPVVRSLAEAGFRGVDKIVLIRPIDDDQRAVKAVSEIKKIASMAGLSDEDIISYRVDVHDFWSSTSMIYSLFLENLREESFIVLCLGGGLRALVLEAYTAFILLPHYLRKKIRVRIDLETGRDSIVIGGEEFIIDLGRLDKEYMVLKVVKENPGINLSTLSYKIGKPVSTTHRLLKRLVEKGFLEKKDGQYYLTGAGRAFLKIKRLLEKVV